jgi:hypothetical protein
MLYGGRVSAAEFLRQLSKKVPPLSKGECWLRLYERWSAVDDIGALAAVHKVRVYVDYAVSWQRVSA